jgi:hypothetical protein
MFEILLYIANNTLSPSLSDEFSTQSSMPSFQLILKGGSYYIRNTQNPLGIVHIYQP